MIWQSFVAVQLARLRVLASFDLFLTYCSQMFTAVPIQIVLRVPKLCVVKANASIAR